MKGFMSCWWCKLQSMKMASQKYVVIPMSPIGNQIRTCTYMQVHVRTMYKVHMSMTKTASISLHYFFCGHAMHIASNILGSSRTSLGLCLLSSYVFVYKNCVLSCCVRMMTFTYMYFFINHVHVQTFTYVHTCIGLFWGLFNVN